MNQRQIALKLRAIYESDLPEMEKLVQSFGLMTEKYITHAASEVELFKAMGDQENLIKRRIQLGMMETARAMFDDCYRSITRRSAWHESD